MHYQKRKEGKQYTAVDIEKCERSDEYMDLIKQLTTLKKSVEVNRDGIYTGTCIYLGKTKAEAVKDGYMFNGTLYLNLSDLTKAVISSISTAPIETKSPMRLWKTVDGITLQEYFDKCLRQT